MTAERLAKLAKHLRQAVFTVENFGTDVKLVKRILRIMFKSVKVCTILGEFGTSVLARVLVSSEF